jgi:hypothetical protein
MILYHYDENFEYAGSSEARPDPLEPGRFLEPRNSTPVAPPTQNEGYAMVFDPSAGKWSQVLDKRGTTFWLSHSDQYVISELGVEVPEGASLEQPPAPEVEVPPADPVQDDPRVKIGRWQGKKWLLRNSPEPGKSYLSIVTEARGMMDGDAALEMDIDMNDAEYWYIDNPSVLTMKSLFNWSDEQLRQAFVEASQINK